MGLIMHNHRTDTDLICIFTRYGMPRVHTPLFELLSSPKILLTQSVILFFNCVSRKLYLVFPGN